MSTDACVNKTERDFELLLTRFNDQNEFFKENVIRINDKLNNLKLEPSPQEKAEGDKDTSGDVISSLSTYLDRMNSLNLRLQRACEKFNELI